MDSKVTIVRADADSDLESVMALLVQQYEYHLSLEPEFGEAEGWQEMKREMIVEHLADPNWLVLLGKVDGQSVALLVATVKQLPPFLRERRIGFIDHLFVRPDFRLQHAGTLMVEYGFEWLRAQDVSSVELWVLSKNEKGKSFWSRTGFRPVRQTMRRSLES